MNQLLFLIEAFSQIDDTEFEGPKGRSQWLATVGVENLVDMLGLESPLFEELRQNFKGVKACKLIVARRIAIGWTMDDKTRNFLERIDGLPTEKDIAIAVELERPKSYYEREQDRVSDITGKLLRSLYPEEGPLPKDGLSVIEVNLIVDYAIKASQRDKDERAGPIDKAIPREWVVSSVESAIRQKPNCEDKIWKIVSFLWARYQISDFGGIENDVFKRLGKPTERQARYQANEMLHTYLNDIATERQDEATVMEWMLDRYRYNFTGKNQAMGDLFGHVYLEEIVKAVAHHNQELAERITAIEEKEASEEGLSHHDLFEKEILKRTIAIDPFFVNRLVAYFQTNGITLKKN